MKILISIIVIIILVMNLRASLIVAGLLPLGVLLTFILMRFFGIEANIVALSGIAIAIGVMVDIGLLMWRTFSGIWKCLRIMAYAAKN